MAKRFCVLMTACAALLTVVPSAAASDRAPSGVGRHSHDRAISIQRLIRQAAASDATATRVAASASRDGVGFRFRPVRPHIDPHQRRFSPDTLGRPQLPPGRDGEPKQSCALNPMQPRCR